ncbi:uncharacterized protein QYS62_005233 [Fusarium acuminatum]|uniref:Uncharacterized protein n=1 Tax=Fusarium acuminatum TaxID=5515 RepID=A0ABZ2WV65_9HYPO
MATKNPDSLHGQGPFHARVPPTQPGAHNWHKPGNEQGNAAAPEFHAQTLPPGTAPPENTFRPNPIDANITEYVDEEDEQETLSLSMPGSTSKDVYNATDSQHGRPLIGQENREIRGVHPRKRKKERSGLEGVGASTSDSVFDKVRDRVADKPDVEKGQRGYTGEREGGLAADGAESIPPVQAEDRDVRKGPHGKSIR